MQEWTSPPTRRELTLLLFCATVFIVAFNASSSFHLIGLDSSSFLPFSSHAAPIGFDGRRLEGHRDHLESEIFGEWEWEPGHIAGVKEAESSRLLHGRSYGHPDAYLRGEGLSGRQAMWLRGLGEGRLGHGEEFGSTSVNDDFVRWGDDVPRTELVQHIPGASFFIPLLHSRVGEHHIIPLGYTILDNVIMYSGTFYVVVDDPTAMPPADVIASSRVNHNSPPRDIDWQVFPAGDAPSKFGTHGGRCAFTSSSKWIQFS